MARAMNCTREAVITLVFASCDYGHTCAINPQIALPGVVFTYYIIIIIIIIIIVIGIFFELFVFLCCCVDDISACPV